MDPISLAIIVTVLSVGSVLVYLFKSDYEGRHKIIIAQTSSSKKNVTASALSSPIKGGGGSSSLSSSSNKQKVPSEVSKQPTTNIKQQSSSSNKQQAVNNSGNSSGSNKSRGRDNNDTVVAPSKLKSLPTITDSLEPAQDELDSSILLGVFNPTSGRPGKSSKKLDQPQPQTTTSSQVDQHHLKKVSRKKQDVVHLVEKPITPEQLFNLLESSNLSKDEVELAVETLLNKLESGESNWQQPKSDPIARLKLRLRDHELALATETANHENTRARLGLVNQSLEQARVDLHKLKEENLQVNTKLEQVRTSDLSKHLMVQKQLKEENSRIMGQLEKVEEDKAQLQSMLLERHLNEASMKRTLLEMEQELKELQSKLSANSASHDERLRKEMSQVERELTVADQREQKLMSEMRELREGLSALFPDIKANSINSRGGVGADDWVHQYLAAVKHLAKTVDELREATTNNNNNSTTNNNNNHNNEILDSPSKKTLDKSTQHSKRPSSRVSSPISVNGRSSKAGSYYENEGKKEMETKLLELQDEIEKTKQENLALASQQNQSSADQQVIKELKLQKSKLEAQVKIGLDSLKMEQERTRSLEEALTKFSQQAQTAS